MNQKQAKAFKTLMRHGWGKESSIFRKVFSTLYLPDANEEQIGWWTELQRIATTPENAVRLRDTIDDIDIPDRLALVKSPTLISHSQREEVAPFFKARRIVARISNTKLVPWAVLTTLCFIKSPHGIAPLMQYSNSWIVKEVSNSAFFLNVDFGLTEGLIFNIRSNGFWAMRASCASEFICNFR